MVIDFPIPPNAGGLPFAPDPAGTAVPVDATDPIILLLTWGVNWALYRFLGPKADAYQYIVPTIAILLALALRAGFDMAQGHPLDSSTLLRAFAAGGGAVLTHAQVRGGQKWQKALHLKRKGKNKTRGTPGGDSEEKTPPPVADSSKHE